MSKNSKGKGTVNQQLEAIQAKANADRDLMGEQKFMELYAKEEAEAQQASNDYYNNLADLKDQNFEDDLVKEDPESIQMKG